MPSKRLPEILRSTALALTRASWGFFLTIIIFVGQAADHARWPINCLYSKVARIILGAKRGIACRCKSGFWRRWAHRGVALQGWTHGKSQPSAPCSCQFWKTPRHDDRSTRRRFSAFHATASRRPLKHSSRSSTSWPWQSFLQEFFFEDYWFYRKIHKITFDLLLLGKYEKCFFGNEFGIFHTIATISHSNHDFSNVPSILR